VSDSISIDGNANELCVLPLERLFAAMPNPPLFEPPDTANWRGYVASWKIEDERLWLVGLRGDLQNKVGRVGTERRSFENSKNYYQSIISRIETLPHNRFGIRQSDENWFGYLIDDDNGFVDLDAVNRMKVDELFCSDAIPVHASWYSGLLRIPTGERLA
jgi:hypothetical protein